MVQTDLLVESVLSFRVGIEASPDGEKWGQDYYILDDDGYDAVDGLGRWITLGTKATTVYPNDFSYLDIPNKKPFRDGLLYDVKKSNKIVRDYPLYVTLTATRWETGEVWFLGYVHIDALFRFERRTEGLRAEAFVIPYDKIGSWKELVSRLNMERNTGSPRYPDLDKRAADLDRPFTYRRLRDGQ